MQEHEIINISIQEMTRERPFARAILLMIGPKAERIGDESLSGQISRSVRHNILCRRSELPASLFAAGRRSPEAGEAALTFLSRGGTGLAGGTTPPFAE